MPGARSVQLGGEPDVAPESLSVSEHPVVITLTVSGYYQEIKNYDVHQ